MLHPLLCSVGHTATAAELLELAHGQHSVVAIWRTRRDIVRVRRGVYVCRHLGPAELQAAALGARVDCLTVLQDFGLPVPEHDRPHLRIAPGSGRAAARARSLADGVVAHWSRPRERQPGWREARDIYGWMRNPRLMPRIPLVHRLQMPLADALRQAIRTCLAPADIVRVLEAAVPLLGADAVNAIIADAPKRLAPLLSAVRLDGGPQ